MAALNFPNSPSVNDIHTENGVSFKWNGTIWKKVGASYLDTTNLNVTGIGTFAGAVNINGVLTYEDVKNVDSVGIVTARTGIHIDDSITHIGDTNTKIRFPAADTFTVETAGQQNVQINGTRVLLKSPSGTNTTVRLQHQGNSGYGDIILDRTVNAFIIDNDPGNAGSNGTYFSVKTIGSERLRITSAGRVGINETSPDRDLHISNTTPYIRVESTSANQPATLELYHTRGNGSDKWPVSVATADAALTFNVATGANGSPAEKLRIESTGHVLPGADNTQNLGSASKRWANIHTGDLHLSNTGSVNSVDGTSGSWTMQEGSDDLFLINNNTGKKYKFHLMEVN